ncbi:MAG: hypothetical protein GY865_00885 [candidate division Zixibacteria bacterium]|nr:hypothetical protein [candidate division Zixibacteria bacterium]
MTADKIEEKTKDTIDLLCQNLSDEKLEQINFDELIEVLGAVKDNVNQEQETATELEYLKEEYRNRIIGMVKANLACRQNERDADLAVKLSDDISEISAEELVGMYGRTAARFRTNFPASFRYLTIPSSQFNGRKNWNEHKI